MRLPVLGLSTLPGMGMVTSPLQMPQLVTALQSTAAKSLSKHVYTCSRCRSLALVRRATLLDLPMAAL